jgi:hypothetical protein
MFISRAGANLSEELQLLHSSASSCRALAANIRLGWKGFSATNTLAYYEHLLIAAIKSFITFGPGKLIKILIEPLNNYSHGLEPQQSKLASCL